MARIKLNNRFAFCLVVLPVFGLASGCRHSGGAQPNQVAHVRLIDAAPGLGEIDAYVNGEKIWKDIEYRNSDSFQDVPGGTYDILISASNGAAGPLFHKSVTFEKGVYYTAWVTGSGTVRMIGEADSDVPADKMELRVLNATGGARPVDWVLNNIVAFKDVRSGALSQALPLEGGPYDIKLFTADEYDSPLAGPIHVTLDPGHRYTLLALTSPDGGSPEISLYADR